MAEVAVVNASPLILMARAGLLDLLQLAAPRVEVPQPVADEVTAYDDRAARAVREVGWLHRVPVPSIPAAILLWDLGAGEAAVLAHALTLPSAEAIIDDLAGRRCAAALGVRVRGTLGLALLAKQLGHVSAAAPVVAELKRAGMFLSEQTLRSALALVGE